MKLRIPFKTPDTVDDSIERHVDQQFECVEEDEYGEGEEEKEAAREKLKDLCEKWIQYGESVTLELDTETGSMTVVPV